MDTVDAVPVFTALVNAVKERYPKLAYLHIVEPRVLGLYDRKEGAPEGESNDFVRDILKGTEIPLISAGGYTTESAVETADQKGDLIAFGRYYISNVRCQPTACLDTVTDKTNHSLILHIALKQVLRSRNTTARPSTCLAMFRKDTRTTPSPTLRKRTCESIVYRALYRSEGCIGNTVKAGVDGGKAFSGVYGNE